MAKREGWTASAPNEWARGYMLGRHDSLFYGTMRGHEGDEDTVEGYAVGFKLMSAHLAALDEWNCTNKELGTASPHTQAAHAHWRECSLELELHDRKAGMYGPPIGGSKRAD